MKEAAGSGTAAEGPGCGAPVMASAPEGPPPPDPAAVADDVRRALGEDLGDGDRTARLIPAATVAGAVVITREPCVLSGRPWFDEVYAQIDPRVRIVWAVPEGGWAAAGTVLCTLRGAARALVSGERCALNFLQLLSGVATRTRAFVDAVAGTGVRILDTRKTLPGLRAAQKYAVRCGGGHNHRMGLYDALLVKENHIATCGSVAAAIAAARRSSPGMPVEIEVEDLDQLTSALEAGAERILLDNFDTGAMRRAVALTAGRARLEASGGIDLARAAAIAATGVDDISVGALTKDVRAVDLSMRFDDPRGGPAPDGAPARD